MSLFARMIFAIATALLAGQCLQAQELTQTRVLEFEGVAEPSSTVEIIPEVQGAITESVSEIGRRVKLGDILMHIDPEAYEIAVERARTRLKFAGIQHEAITNELKRLEDLFAKRLTTKDLIYTTNLAKQLAQGELEDAEVDLREAELRLEQTIIKTPIDGIISQINVNVGDIVGRTSDPAYVLVSYDPIRVRVFVDQQSDLEIARDMHRQKAILQKINLRLSDGSLHPQDGTFIGSSHQVDVSLGKVAYYLSFPNENLLILPGASVTAVITIQTVEN